MNSQSPDAKFSILHPYLVSCICWYLTETKSVSTDNTNYFSVVVKLQCFNVFEEINYFNPSILYIININEFFSVQYK